MHYVPTVLSLSFSALSFHFSFSNPFPYLGQKVRGLIPRELRGPPPKTGKLQVSWTGLLSSLGPGTGVPLGPLCYLSCLFSSLSILHPTTPRCHALFFFKSLLLLDHLPASVLPASKLAHFTLLSPVPLHFAIQWRKGEAKKERQN